MLFFKRPDFRGDEAEAHRQLSLLGVPRIDPDTREPLTLEQRLKLLELEIVVMKREGIDPIKPKGTDQ